MLWWSRIYANISQRPLRGPAIMLSLLLIIVAATSTIILARSFKDQVEDILATHNVSEQALGLLAPLNETYTSERGYLLTNDVTFLDQLRKAEITLNAYLSTLEKMTEGNPRQHAMAMQIRQLADIREKAGRTALQIAIQGKIEEGSALLNSTFRVRQLDEIATAVNGFLTDEDTRLAQRNIAMDRMRSALSIASLSSLGGAMILAFILSSRRSRYVRQLIEGQSELLTEKSILEAMVQNRTAELEKAMQVAKRERERVETLLQDSDHRIGNSLATVSSLLGIQMRKVSAEETRAALAAARDRIQTISSAHRRLRLGKDHETIRTDEYLPAVIADIKESNAHNRDIAIHARMAPIELHSRDATTLGIIIGELTMNAIKHAFPARRSGEINVDLARSEDGIVTLQIADSGVGMDKKPRKTAAGLGTLIVDQLSHQYGGSVIYGSNGLGGTTVTVDFPALPAVEKDIRQN